MFQRVKWRLTITNIMVIGSILIFVSQMIYWGSPQNHAEEISFLLEKLVQGGIPEEQQGKMRDEAGQGEVVYAQLSTRDTVSNLVLPDGYDETEARSVLRQIVADGRSTGEMDTDEVGKIRYVQTEWDQEGLIRVAFMPTISKSEGFLSYLSRTIFFILISLVLVLFGSLLIAGRALIPIRQSWQRQMDFTADASHELRTPLTVIGTNLELVIDNREETVESQLRWLNNIQVESQRLGKLVEDLLTLSRADSGQKTVQKLELDLNAVLMDAITPQEPRAEQKGIQIEFNLEPHIYMKGDSDRLKQLLVILLDNAIHYTAPGGRIQVRLMRKDKSVELTVADTGSGISKEHLPYIFDRFYREDQARTRNQGGSGLGLSIAKWIVEEHHGHIQVESKQGAGTLFRIRFPASTNIKLI